MDAKPTASDTSWAATRTDSQLKSAYVPPSGKEGKRELQQNNAVAAELRKRGIPLPGRRADDTKGLRNQVKRHQAAAARGNGKSLTQDLPAGHGASLQESKDAQARIAARAAAARQQPAHESAASQKAKNEARLAADDYVSRFGADGAREKLAQLRARKVKSAGTQRLIDALEAKVGSGGAPRVGNRRPGKG